MTFDEWFSSVFGTIQTHQAELFKDELEALWNLAQANRKWVGLTDEEIAQGMKGSWVTQQVFESAVWWAEAKLKEKNT